MLYFIIPVYNEELNIKELSISLKNALPDYLKHYIFVDDHSSDETIEKINKYFDKEEIKIITKSKNKGPGDSFDLGFKYLMDKKIKDNDLIVTIEADNTSDIDILEKMVTISVLGYDLVLASPYAQGGGFEETTLLRKVLSFTANSILRFLFDVKVLTLSSFYRVYKPSLIRKINDKYGTIIKEPGFICMVEILIKSIRCNAKVIEVPMKLYSKKRQGKSKMKILSTGLSYMKFLLKNRF
ncbi:MAG: glycosyltransferase family 2 protein [Candidatus Delongbacteria bacterium]|jgi:glycosyltransferase involved in cell wall biosynthesis|nr:glycosyltransferase family 2 protein [Candidatus Delongbacteria bacterium]